MNFNSDFQEFSYYIDGECKITLSNRFNFNQHKTILYVTKLNKIYQRPFNMAISNNYNFSKFKKG